MRNTVSQDFVLKSKARITKTIKDCDGEELGVISFNPGDVGIVARYNETMKRLDALDIAGWEQSLNYDDIEDASRKVEEMHSKIADVFDYFLGTDSRSTLFAKTTPLATFEDGDCWIDKILFVAAHMIEQTTGERLKRKQQRIKRATAKYRK